MVLWQNRGKVPRSTHLQSKPPVISRTKSQFRATFVRLNFVPEGIQRELFTAIWTFAFEDVDYKN